MTNIKDITCPRCKSSDVKIMARWYWSALFLIVLILAPVLVFNDVPIFIGLILIVALDYYVRFVLKDSLCKKCGFRFNLKKSEG